MSAVWPNCGHSRNDINTYGRQCRTCHRLALQRWRQTQNAQTAYRVRVLPDQLGRARRRLAYLEAEARRLGMTDLLVAQ